MNDLLKLQEWYEAQCDGSWEHTWGVLIETIDNPGWQLKIDIVDTGLAGKPFAEVKFQGPNENDWYVCKANEVAFEAFCGPARLVHVIGIFIRWTEA